MEDDLKKKGRRRKKNGRRPQIIKWKTNQSTRNNLIGCDTIVNSPSERLLVDAGATSCQYHFILIDLAKVLLSTNHTVLAANNNKHCTACNGEININWTKKMQER